MVRLDEGRFPALELNNRRLSVKNSFCRKNGIYTRSVPTSHLSRNSPKRIFEDKADGRRQSRRQPLVMYRRFFTSSLP